MRITVKGQVTIPMAIREKLDSTPTRKWSSRSTAMPSE